MHVRWTKSRAVAPLALVFLGLVGAAAPAPSVADGYLITQRIVADEETITLHVKVSQGRIRIELDSDKMPGMYMLAREDGRVTAVLAEQGMAMVMDPSMITGGMEGMMGGLMQSSVSDVSVAVEDLGAGEALLTRATRKYRMRTRYKMSMTMMGQTTESTHDVTQEMWMAADVPGLADGLQKFTELFGNAFSGIGGGVKQLSDAMKAKTPKGYPMKVVVSDVETETGGQPKTNKATIEVTEIRKITVEASDFEVPAGLQVMDVGQMMRGRGGR